MSQVRCPFCGAANLPDAESCKTCGSRLAPMKGEPDLPAPGSESESTGNWLDSLRSDSGEPAGWQDETEGEETAEPAEMPDWLARIREKSQAESSPDNSLFTIEGEDEDSLPDWMSAAIRPEGAEEPEPEGETDWLNNLRPAETPASEEPAAESEAEITPAGEDEEQDWLKNLSAWAEETSADVEPPSEEPEAEPEPRARGPIDWMQRLANEPIAQFDGTVEPAPETPEQTPAEGAKSLDWLDHLAEDTTEAEQVTPLAFESDDTEPVLPFEIEDSQAFATEPEARSALESALPFSLDDLTETEQPDAGISAFLASEETEPAAAAFPADDLPDWLQGLAAEPASEDESPALAETPAFEETQPEPAVETEAEPATPFAFDEVPDWLSDYRTEDTFLGEEEAPAEIGQELPPLEAAISSPFASDELPNWLGKEADAEPPTETTPAEPETLAEPLQMAQLPGWLEAMRPVESVITERASIEADQHMERSGPLAGIPGALPGEESATRYNKPPVYSTKLQVTEKQRLHASLLEAMIAEEQTPRPAERERRMGGQALPRTLVGLALIAVLVLALLGVLPTLRYPSLFPVEAVNFHNTLTGLAAEAGSSPQILVVIDYQPALAGELEAAALGPLQDLAAQNARLALLSAQPLGPVLGGRLLDQLALQTGDFNAASQAINLGYLAGGSTGSQAFATNPRLTVQSTFDTQNAWDSPVLQGIDSLDDFSAVLVLTDSVEGGRDWIEQFQAWRGETPLLVVSSALAGPLLQPYADSNQVQGLLSGWLGGVSYNFISRQLPGMDIASWNAYQYGMGALIALILLGGLFQGIATLFSGRKDSLGG